MTLLAQSLGAQGELREHPAGERVLLLPDKLEQVPDAAPLIADLLGLLRDARTARDPYWVRYGGNRSPVVPLGQARATCEPGARHPRMNRRNNRLR